MRRSPKACFISLVDQKNSGIAPKSIQGTLSLGCLRVIKSGAQKSVANMSLSVKTQCRGEPRLELLEPVVNEAESPIAKYLKKKGGGIHHIAMTVSDVSGAIAIAKQHGVRMIDEVPRSGAHHTQIAFVHPESTGGILVALVQGR